MDVIKTEGLSVCYQDKVVFKDVSIKISQGEFVAIVGPNGSGKSSLLKSFIKLAPICAGYVQLFSDRQENFKDWQRLCYISQYPLQSNRLFPITVQEVVALGLKRQGFCLPSLDKSEQHQILASLELVGLAGLKEQLLGKLSGGQRQKVFLAKAFLSGADLFLLDEPTSGVDADAKLELYSLLRSFSKVNNKTIVLVTHDMEYALNSVDKLLCLEQGSVCYWGDAEGAFSHRHKSGYYFTCKEVNCGHI